MSATLEEMARALFRSWFVGFEPVRAKAEGRPSGLPPALDALFPSSFEASELGPIPSGWAVRGLGDALRRVHETGQNPSAVPRRTTRINDYSSRLYQANAPTLSRFPAIHRASKTEPRPACSPSINPRQPRRGAATRRSTWSMAIASRWCVGRASPPSGAPSGSRSYTSTMRCRLPSAFRRPLESPRAPAPVRAIRGHRPRRCSHSMPWLTPPDALVEAFEATYSASTPHRGGGARANALTGSVIHLEQDWWGVCCRRLVLDKGRADVERDVPSVRAGLGASKVRV